MADLSVSDFLNAKPAPGTAPDVPVSAPSSGEMTPEQFMAAKPTTAPPEKPIGAAKQVLAGTTKGIAGLASMAENAGIAASPMAGLYGAAGVLHYFAPKTFSEIATPPDVGSKVLEAANKAGIQTPEPQTLGEYIEQGVGSFLPFVAGGEGSAGMRALNALRTVAAGAISGAGQFVGKRVGSLFGPEGEKVGSQVGALTGAVTPAAVEGTVRKIIPVAREAIAGSAPATEGLQNLNAIRKLQGVGVDTETLPAAINARMGPGAEMPTPSGTMTLGPKGELVPESLPTTAALTGSPALAELQSVRENANPPVFQTARTAQDQARMRALDALTPVGASAEAPAEAAAATKASLEQSQANAVKAAQAAREGAWEGAGGQEGPAIAGGAARDLIAGNRAVAKGAEDAAWTALRNRNPSLAMPDLKGATEAVENEFQKQGLQNQPVVTSFMNRLKTLGPNPTWAQIQGVRQELGDALRSSVDQFGQSTTATHWLGELRGTLDNAIEQAAGRPIEAPVAGVQSESEQSSIARQIADWQARRASENAELDSILGRGWSGGTAQRAGSRAAAVKSVGEAPVLGAPGAGGTPEGGLPAGESGAGAPQEPVSWSAEDAALYGQAKAATAARKTVFDKNSTLGQVLAKNGPQGYKLTEEQAAKRLFPGGDNSRQAAMDFKGGGGDVETYAQIAAADLRNRAMSADGSLNSTAYSGWMKRHSGALSVFPEIKDRFATVGKAQEAVDQAMAAKDAAIADYQKSAARLVLGKEPMTSARSMFSASTPISDVKSLSEQMASNPDAAEGLKRITADYISQKFIKELAHGDEVARSASVAQLRNFLNGNREKLTAILGDDGVESIARVLHDYERSDIYAMRRIAGSRTSRDLQQAAQSEIPRNALAYLLRRMMSPVGVVGTWLLSPAAGAIDALISMKGPQWQAAANGILDDALLDPNKMKLLLEKVPNDAAAQARFAKQLRGTFIGTAATAGRPEERKGRASGGRIEAWTPKDVEKAARLTDHAATGDQKTADNYRKGRFKFAHGLLSKLGSIAIETGKGRTRIAHDGSWKVPNMPAHYGHLTNADGSDGDKADVFVGDDLSSRRVWVINQINLKTGKFDETKSMLGFPSEEAARKAYIHSFSDGKGEKRIGSITEVPADVFVDLAKADKLKSPVGRKAFAGGGLAQDLQDIGGDLSSGLLNQGIVALANRYPAVDRWRMGLGQRVGELINDPVGFYKSAVEDVTPNPKGLMQTMAGLNTPEAQQAKKALMNIGLAGLTVYHGSPYNFDQFDASKIGTGEGAQAYSHGLYFAGTPETGNFYKNMLSARHRPELTVNGQTVPISAYVSDHLGSPSKPADLEGAYNESVGDLERLIERHSDPAYKAYKNSMDPNVRPWLDQNDALDLVDAHRAISLLDEARKGAPHQISYPGHIYKVDIPDETVGNMIEWEKPMSEQVPSVTSAWKRSRALLPASANADLGGDYSLLYGKDVMPEDFFGAMSSLGGSPGYGERTLGSLGVPGVKYWDQASRTAGSGTRNVVLWPGHEHLAKIIGKNP